MAKFTFNDQVEKTALQNRAIQMKPKVTNVVATALGWAQPRPNGTLELLVSFAGLDELLGDVSAEVIDPTPLEINIPELLEQVADTVEDVPVAILKRKAGRPAMDLDVAAPEAGKL